MAARSGPAHVGETGHLARRRWPFRLVLVALTAVLFVTVVLAVTIGPVHLSPGLVWRIAFDRVVPGVLTPTWQEFQANIAWEIRFPRVLLAALVGAGLSVVGATLQAVLRNPLADPYLLGTSSGAALGAVGVLLFGSAAFGALTVSAAAFVGALAASFLVFVLAYQGGRFPTGRLILSGVAVSYLFSAATNVMLFRAPGADQTRGALFWLLGGFGSARWSALGVPGLVLAAATVALMVHSRTLNVLSVGEEAAATLGIEGDRVRRQAFLLTSLVTGVLVALSGGIGFVGLMAPHLARLVVGGDHRRLIPVAAVGGAIFLVWADVAARVVVAPEELPIGIITALVGAPFFLWLMRRRGRTARAR